MVAGCSLVFVLVVLVSTLLIFPSGRAAVEDSESYDKDAQSLDVEAYAQTILAQTEDAGQSYLDETLFVGDSNAVRLYGFGLLKLENYMGKEGMGIEGVPVEKVVYFKDGDSPCTIPDAIRRVQPRRVILMFGTNNANGSTTTESFISTYRKSVKAIQDAYPYCDIIIAAIPPKSRISEYPDVSMQTIDEFNKALVSLAEEMGLKFLNTSEALKDESGYAKSGYLDSDGLHFSLTGAKTLLEYVRTHADESEDRRPTVTNVPERAEPPASSSSQTSSSSEESSSSSSESSSSESMSSSAVSSSSETSSASSGASSDTSSQTPSSGQTSSEQTSSGQSSGASSATSSSDNTQDSSGQSSASSETQQPPSEQPGSEDPGDGTGTTQDQTGEPQAG